MNNIRVGEKSSTTALYLYFTFKTVTALISLVSIYFGYKLFILGVTGKASLSMETGTVKGQLVNAAPGLFFAVGGIISLIVIVWKGVSITFNDNGLFSAANVRHVPLGPKELKKAMKIQNGKNITLSD
jgi:hypothetical protein